MSSGSYTAGPEMAPSVLTEDQVSFARTIGLTGLMACVLGVLILILNAAQARLPVDLGNNVAFAGIVIGMAMMFFQATRDTDQLIRRLFGYVGGIGLPMSGAILSLVPLAISAAEAPPEGVTERKLVSQFFPFGWACFLGGLFFLIPFCRNESDHGARKIGLGALFAIGGVLGAAGLIGGLINANFALTYGSVLSLLGLAYLVAFINQVGGADGDGYRPAMGVMGVGVVVFLVALIRSVIPGGQAYFIPGGLMMMAVGGLFVLTGLFLASDWKLIVLTRREVFSFFYSPIAYVLLFMSALVAAKNYADFGEMLLVPRMEPVVLYFFLGSLWAPFLLMFQVPVLTMRQFSEERRSGTYEVLMCAPVSETPVVVSKLLASLLFYLLIWAIWLVFLLHMRVESGLVFEYRTLITFFLTMAATGASFLSMGLFFSSLTKSQLVAAALTFFGMCAWLAVFFVLQRTPETSSQHTILSHLSFVDLWLESLNGRLHLRDIIIQLSLTVFWCFLTVRVLDARRWA